MATITTTTAPAERKPLYTSLFVQVLAGLILGIVAMRMVVGQLLVLVQRYPALVDGAFVIIAWIGVKLGLDYLHAIGWIAFEIPQWLSIGLVLTIFAIAFMGCVLATPFVTRIAAWTGAIDRPDQFRRVHKGAVPRMGGLGLAFGLLFSVIGTIIWVFWPAKPDSKWKKIGAFGRGKGDREAVQRQA